VVDEERFMAHDGAIHALAFTKDGELLASAAADGKVHFSSAPALSELFFFNFAKYLL
jgi:WD40 repeat protein